MRTLVITPPPLLLCLQVLRNSYVLAYSMEQPAARRYLEHLQSQLAMLVEALAAPLLALPGARSLPLHAVVAPSSSRTAGSRYSGEAGNASPAAEVDTGRGASSRRSEASLYSWMFPASCQKRSATPRPAGASGGAAFAQRPSAGDPQWPGQDDATLAALAGLHGMEASEQLLYSLVLLMQHRGAIEALIQQAERYRQTIVRAARAGLLTSAADDGGGGGALSGRVAGGRPDWLFWPSWASLICFAAGQGARVSDGARLWMGLPGGWPRDWYRQVAGRVSALISACLTGVLHVVTLPLYLFLIWRIRRSLERWRRQREIRRRLAG